MRCRFQSTFGKFLCIFPVIFCVTLKQGANIVHFASQFDHRPVVVSREFISHS